MSHLVGRRLNLQHMREVARREFSDVFSQIQGSKAIGWADNAILDSLNLIVDWPFLQELDVVRMFHVDAEAAVPETENNVIFIAPPDLQKLTAIADLILLTKEQRNACQHTKFHIMFVPRQCFLCKLKLEDMSVMQYVQFWECPIELFPLDNDLLSMENPAAFREFALDHDHSSLFVAARALITIQSIHGTIQHVYGKGEAAQTVFDYMTKMRKEIQADRNEITPQIDNLLLIDRSVDLISLLPTQLTFEGLIDERFGLKSTTVRLPGAKFRPPDEKQQINDVPEVKKLILNSSEELFAQLRDKNFTGVGGILSRKAKAITAEFDERLNANVQELKKFTSKLNTLQASKASLAKQTAIAELVKELIDQDDFMDKVRVEQAFMEEIDLDKPNPFIEDCINRREDVIRVLRLMCLQCVMSNGLKQKVLDSYRRDIIQTYGYQYFPTLLNLEKVGLLSTAGWTSSTTRTMEKIKGTMKLMLFGNSDVPFDDQNPTDLYYVFSGYAPLSVRLAQYLATPGWRGIETILKVLPGPRVDAVQDIPTVLRRKRGGGGGAGSYYGAHDNPQITVVFFLGGVTYAEISALRFLTNSEDHPTEYIIATTGIVNGTSLLTSLDDDFKQRYIHNFRENPDTLTISAPRLGRDV